MKKNKYRVFGIAMLCVLLINLLTFSFAYASPSAWYLPWSRSDQNSMNSVILFNCNVTYARDPQSVTADSGGTKYYGYWHVLSVRFATSSGAAWLNIIAPADGTVIYSENDLLDVKTDDGDLYELSTSGSRSSMTKLKVGKSISAGEVVGEVYLKETSPSLEIQYLVDREPTYLFGIKSKYFVNGADLTDYDCNTYVLYNTDTPSGSSSSGSSSKPDLILNGFSWSGGKLTGYNTYYPNYPIKIGANVTVVGDIGSSSYNLYGGNLTVRWILGDTTIDKLYWVDNPGDPLSLTIDWTPPQNGYYKISCILDPNNDIQESQEDNNGRYMTFEVDDFSGWGTIPNIGW